MADVVYAAVVVDDAIAVSVADGTANSVAAAAAAAESADAQDDSFASAATLSVTANCLQQNRPLNVEHGVR